jgi:DNA polymerase sigma
MMRHCVECAQVTLFGSVANGLVVTSSNDIDVCLELPEVNDVQVCSSLQALWQQQHGDGIQHQTTSVASCF